MINAVDDLSHGSGQGATADLATAMFMIKTRYSINQTDLRIDHRLQVGNPLLEVCPVQHPQGDSQDDD